VLVVLVGVGVGAAEGAGVAVEAVLATGVGVAVGAVLATGAGVAVGVVPVEGAGVDVGAVFAVGGKLNFLIPTPHFVKTLFKRFTNVLFVLQALVTLLESIPHGFAAVAHLAVTTAAFVVQLLVATAGVQFDTLLFGVVFPKEFKSPRREVTSIPLRHPAPFMLVDTE